MLRLPSHVQSYLSDGVTHMCRCLWIKPVGRQAFGLTDHNRDLIVKNVTYHAEMGINPSVAERAADLSRDGLEIEAILNSPHFCEDDLRKGVYDGAQYKFWLVEWRNEDMVALLSHGTFGAVRMEGGQFIANLEGASSELQYKTGRIFQKNCDAVLGDARCRFKLAGAGWVCETAILGGDKLGLHIPRLDQYETGWFTQGEVIFTTGDLTEVKALVKDDVVQNNLRYLHLWESLPVNPSKGDDIILKTGCDKQFSTCQKKFSNAINFQGMPHIPSDHLLIKATRS